MSQILESILAKNTDIVSSTRPKLPAFFEDSQKPNHLKVDLAAVIDCGEYIFVKATYNLEGDGPLALTYCKTIQGSNLPYRLGIFQMCRQLPRAYHHPLQFNSNSLHMQKLCQTSIELRISNKNLLRVFKFHLLLLKNHGF